MPTFGKVDRALSVWREAIKNQCASTSIFNSLLDLCHELRPEEIPNLQEQLRQAQLTPNEYTFAIQLKTAASFEEAYEIFQRLKEDQDHPPNVVCYNTLLKRCGADSRHHALEIIQEMIDRDIQPDDITFIHMIKLATTGGSFSEAWQVYELLKDRIDMTTNSMNCMINCCSHFRSLPHAEQVLRDMDQFEMIPDVTTFNSMIKAACNGDAFPRALELFAKMQDTGFQPDIITYNTLIRKAAMVNITKAEDLYKEMQQQGFQPDLNTFVPLATVFAKQNFVYKLKNIVKEMKRLGVRPNDYIHKALRSKKLHFDKI